jgi:outer membrane protein OmpA-like peptidoglycan-associated protein/tetratricopeptide (TPR) repeat protein
MEDRKILNGILQFFRLNFILLCMLFLLTGDIFASASAGSPKENDRGRDVKLLYRIANNYFEARNYEKAIQYYDSVINISPAKYPLAFYRKGIVCMNLQMYDAAKESFAKLKKYYGKKDTFNYKKLAVIYSANSEWAKAGADTNGNIIITHQVKDLNHSDIDFSPSPVDDNTIIYGAASSDNNTQINPVRQIYKAEKIDGKWQSAGLLEGRINNPDFNTGNAVISDDGKSIFFTRSRKNWQNEFISEIFVSHLEGDQWQAPQKLPYPINREDYTATQPAPGRNLRTGRDILYFASDRPGGRGGMDIWYSLYDKRTDTYTNPVALSNKVNSMGDECTPFYDISTQTLYFSSTGRKNGLGGYDIFKSTGSAGKWTDAVPMPKPVNSSFDDYYFSIMKSNREGFFSSNRPGSLTLGNGTCCDDIYSFFINECVKIFSWGTVRNAPNYDFYDNLNEKYHLGLKYPEANSTIPDVPVELYLTDEKGNDEMLIGRTTTGMNGTYNFGLETDKYYKILVKNYGYMEKRVSANTLNIFCSDTIDFGTVYIAYLPKITIQLNIYYDFDKYKLSDSARQVIDSMVLPLFDIFPTGIVEIGSHTDNKGTDEYNIDLSQKRSESVVSYLISKGISPKRLVAKGYGMRNPIAPNTNNDGTDNPEGRQLNRRTEFKIVGEVSEFYKDEY